MVRTQTGWYLCVQLDDLQTVCEGLFRRPDIRYTRDYYPPEVTLPFLIQDIPTEDINLRVLQVVEFPQAQQVVSYGKSLRPSWVAWKKRRGLPNWIWENPPWPHLDESGYRQVAIGSSAFYCASEDDKPMLERWFDLLFKDKRIIYSSEYHDINMPFMISISRVDDLDYVIATTIPTDDLILLVEKWEYYLAVRKMYKSKWREYSANICAFIDNLILARWPINQPLNKPPNTM